MSRKTQKRRFPKFTGRKKHPRRFNKQARIAHSYDSLEARRLLAFSYGFVGDTLTLTQTVDDGAVTVDNNGPGDAFQTNDSGGLVTYVAATNIAVNLLDGTSNQLDFDLDNTHTGNVELNLGDGARDVNFLGTSNSMGGDLMVTAGAGNQIIEIGVNNPLTVGGYLAFDLGIGFDAVDEGNSDISVVGDFDFVNVNFFANGGTMTVGGNVTVDTTGEVEDTQFGDDATMTIAGDFTFLGGDGRDEIMMNGVAAGTSVGGNALLDVGDNTQGGIQFLFFNQPNSSVAGTLTAISTSATHADRFALHPLGSYGGDIHVDLGEGANDVVFRGVFGGTDVRYDGGNDVDHVTYGMTGNPANVNIMLGAGDDHFTLNAGASISPNLRVDFGGGTDSFANGFGAFNFNASFLNWDGFNRFYKYALDHWEMVQLSHLGDITIGNNVGGEIELTHTYATTMSQASTIRLNAINDSGNVAVDLASPLAGDAILNLHHGDRNVVFVGTNNSVGGDVLVEAADGVQTVNLTVNNGIDVGGFVVVNLREGVDVVHNFGNSIVAGESLIFRGVNNFENNGIVAVDAMLMNTSFETEEARLDNDGLMFITNTLIYIGGDSKDDIILNDGVVVGGNVSLDVGDNLDEMPAQNVNLNGFHGLAGVWIIGGDSFGGNSIVTDGTTVIDGDFIIDFTANTSSNQAVFLGTYTGNLGYYQGGSGEDVVSMEEVAGDMDFIVKLGESDDTFNLGDGTSVVYLFVNFGEGTDTFYDEFDGIYPFATNFWNLP